MHTVNTNTLMKVQEIAMQHLDMSKLEISDFVLADWNDPQIQQEWLNTAAPEDIAHWVVNCNPNRKKYQLTEDEHDIAINFLVLLELQTNNICTDCNYCQMIIDNHRKEPLEKSLFHAKVICAPAGRKIQKLLQWKDL